MRIIFAYDIEKDAENLSFLKSINNPAHTEIQKLYIEKYGQGFEKEKVKKFIQEYLLDKGFDAESILSEFRSKWQAIESIFVERAEIIFNIKYPQDVVHAFISINNRSTYNIAQNYFFLSIRSKSPALTIMHELFHFYTWHAFHERLIGQGVSEKFYNDIKESLTVLLNLEFSDLLDGIEDKGYPQHYEMREQIQKLWSEDKNLENVISRLILTGNK